MRLEAAQLGPNSKRALIATSRIQGYRCVSARAETHNGVVQVEAATLAALKLEAGAAALIWVDDAN